MKYYIWDKVSNINNASAEYMLSKDSRRIDEQVVIFTTDLGRPEYVMCESDLKDNFGLQGNTVDELAEAYIQFRKIEEQKQHEEQLNIEDAHNKISILEKQNKELEDAILELASII